MADRPPPLLLLIGANGFIGSAIAASCLSAGWRVRAAVRDPQAFSRRLPEAEAVSLDLLSPQARDPAHWLPLLAGVDAVVNAAGVLQPRRDQDAFSVHAHAPLALFEACERAQVRRVIHISATGIEEAQTVYARSKRAGDEALMASGALEWTILRPSLVIGDGSFGGTSLVRALAAMPIRTPMIGDGSAQLDVVHKDDLASSIVALIEGGAGKREILYPASQRRETLSSLLSAYRGWLGLPPVPSLNLPEGMVRIIAKAGDWMALHPITSTSLAQFSARLTGEADQYESATGIKARSLKQALSARMSESQDLWHARLFLLRPLLRITLALMWLISGLLGLFTPVAVFAEWLAPLTSNALMTKAMAVGTGLIDLCIAYALLRGWRLKQLALVQMAMVAGYTVGLSALAPGLWLDPLGPLLKNLPIFVLIVIHRVLEEER